MELPYSNKLYDEAELIVQAPQAGDLQSATDPEIFMRRLEETEGSPWNRVWILAKTTLNPRETELTHEAYFIRKMALYGASAGMLFGGLLSSQDIHQSYVRKHNASVFEGKYRANRHFWDTLISGVIRRGFGPAVSTCLLSTSAGFIAFGSIAYRHKLHLPDWIVGFALLGGASRFWLGPKATAAGSLFGVAAGLLGYGIARGIEISSGQSVAQLRYLNHQTWRIARETKMRNYQEVHEKLHMDYLATILRREE